jgi:ribosomal protein L7/L12
MTPTTIPPHAQVALHEGRKLEAVRRTREATGLGLQEAMAAVEAWEAEHPTPEALYSQDAREPSVAPSRMVAVVVALLVLGLAAWMMFA